MDERVLFTQPFDWVGKRSREVERLGEETRALHLYPLSEEARIAPLRWRKGDDRAKLNESRQHRWRVAHVVTDTILPE